MTQDKPPQRWRENVEALTMAIVVALLFKYFVLEISKIPSGSMQPTLMGNPETGVFDRTLVDKLSFRLRDPERFEIVVFKHPLERSRIMVKRLVGMPGEELKIERGDLWVRPDESAAWRILRRPPSVQRETWRSLVARGRKGRSAWSVVRGGKDWRVSDEELVARGSGAARFLEGEGPITDHYLDGYPPALVEELGASSAGRHPVGDVRLAGVVSALPGAVRVRVELTEGLRTYEFELPGPSAPDDARLAVRIRDSAAGTERVEHGPAYRLPSGAATSFAVENLDDRLAIEIEDRVLLQAEIETSVRLEASLTVSVEGEGVDLSGLAVYRDVHYLAPDERNSWTVTIPDGHYVMLGDNTQDSADSRLWQAKTYDFEAPGEGVVRIRGNYRGGGENPAFGTLADGRPAIRFRDGWGEIHWLARSGVRSESLPGNEPLVSRELILGRALAVFWPIRPLQGLWRLGWVH
jgi:signal peptidase I